MRRLLVLTLLSVPAFAVPISYGPAQIGSESPFADVEYHATSATSGNLFIILPGAGVGSTPGSYQAHISDSFYFALDPGWQIGNIIVGDPRDYGIDERNPVTTAVNYRTSLTLCPIDQNCFVRAQQQGLNVGLVPPLDPLDVPPAGSGIYQFDAATYNLYLGGAAGNAFANVFLDQVSETPEPSTLALLGTGALGLFGVMRRRLSIGSCRLP